MQASLCVFLRAPNLGQVKSRLAASIGEAAALAAHIALVDHLLEQLGPLGAQQKAEVELQLWLGDEPADPASQRVLQRWKQGWGNKLWHQRGTDLGERMASALASCLAQGRYGLLVGCDCPTIDAAYVLQALSALRGGADVVLGPAEDGGYGLVGLAQPQPALFHGVEWGTDRVLAQTLARAQENALEVALLDTLWDVDYAEDWDRFCANFGDSSS